MTYAFSIIRRPEIPPISHHHRYVEKHSPNLDGANVGAPTMTAEFCAWRADKERFT